MDDVLLFRRERCASKLELERLDVDLPFATSRRVIPSSCTCYLLLLPSTFDIGILRARQDRTGTSTFLQIGKGLI